MLALTRLLVTWSRTTTTAATSAARAKAATRTDALVCVISRGHSARSHDPAHQPEIRLTTTVRTMYSTMIAIIGVRSNMPIGGMKRRKIFR